MLTHPASTVNTGCVLPTEVEPTEVQSGDFYFGMLRTHCFTKDTVPVTTGQLSVGIASITALPSAERHQTQEQACRGHLQSAHSAATRDGRAVWSTTGKTADSRDSSSRWVMQEGKEGLTT